MNINRRDEIDRLAALDRYAVMDTPADPRFDRLTRLAAAVFEVPIAVIALIDSQRQWFKSRVGLPSPRSPRHVFRAHNSRGDACSSSRTRTRPAFSRQERTDRRRPSALIRRSAAAQRQGKHRHLAIVDRVTRRFEHEQDARLADSRRWPRRAEILRVAASRTPKALQALFGTPEVTFSRGDGTCPTQRRGHRATRKPDEASGARCEVRIEGAEHRRPDAPLPRQPRQSRVRPRSADASAVRAVVLSCRDGRRARRERRLGASQSSSRLASRALRSGVRGAGASGMAAGSSASPSGARRTRARRPSVAATPRSGAVRGWLGDRRVRVPTRARRGRGAAAPRAEMRGGALDGASHEVKTCSRILGDGRSSGADADRPAGRRVRHIRARRARRRLTRQSCLNAPGGPAELAERGDLRLRPSDAPSARRTMSWYAGAREMVVRATARRCADRRHRSQSREA